MVWRPPHFASMALRHCLYNYKKKLKNFFNIKIACYLQKFKLNTDIFVNPFTLGEEYFICVKAPAKYIFSLSA
ncbi:hypothetical protein BpHYR1_048071 [Brachionus plicatilis]|uniref:Uncharacterized protein n=1 Tax=Brachionus plicatilis TaxID=10195 RepID=A0A3M7S2C2_BRAPC|nr:hypothetical protein BpHYR1_048071 [Brachionus plicatilis]